MQLKAAGFFKCVWPSSGHQELKGQSILLYFNAFKYFATKSIEYLTLWNKREYLNWRNWLRRKFLRSFFFFFFAIQYFCESSPLFVCSLLNLSFSDKNCIFLQFCGTHFVNKVINCEKLKKKIHKNFFRKNFSCRHENILCFTSFSKLVV